MMVVYLAGERGRLKAAGLVVLLDFQSAVSMVAHSESKKVGKWGQKLAVS